MCFDSYVLSLRMVGLRVVGVMRMDSAKPRSGAGCCDCLEICHGWQRWVPFVVAVSWRRPFIPRRWRAFGGSQFVKERVSKAS